MSGAWVNRAYRPDESDEDLNEPASIKDITSSAASSSGRDTPRTGDSKQKKKLHNRPIKKDELGNDSCANSGSLNDDSFQTVSCASETDGTGSNATPKAPAAGGVKLPPPGGRVEPTDALDDEEEEREGQLSVGSALHDQGTCKPCLFRYTSTDCKNGYNCAFCHLSHRRGSRNRPCKGKRDRYKKLIARQDETVGEADPGVAVAESSGVQEPVCRFWLSGQCKRGNTCEFRHPAVAPPGTVGDPRASEERAPYPQYGYPQQPYPQRAGAQNVYTSAPQQPSAPSWRMSL